MKTFSVRSQRDDAEAWYDEAGITGSDHSEDFWRGLQEANCEYSESMTT